MQLGPDFALAQRLKRIEDWIARMNANPLGQGFSTTQSDGSLGLVIGQDPDTGAARLMFHQGTTTARDANTDQHPTLLYIGEVYNPTTKAWEGSTVIFFGPNGNRMIVGGSQGFGVLDDQLNSLVATDDTTREGLSEPWIPLPPPAPLGTGSWPKTTSTTVGTVASCEFRAQHGKVWWVAQAVCDSGTTATVQATITGAGGTVATGPAHTVSGTTFITINDTLSLPAGFWGQTYNFNVNCQVTGGTGNVYCQTFNLYGRGN